MNENRDGAGNSAPTTTGDRTSKLRSFTKPLPSDEFVFQRVRLAILTALSVSRLSFVELRELLKVGDGLLSRHARKLEEAGYLECNKFFVARVPRTEYRLTRKGRAAIRNHLDGMNLLVEASRKD